MKDTAHHLGNIQRKVIRENRQEQLKALSLESSKPTLVSTESQPLSTNGTAAPSRAVSPKRAGMPKKMKAQSYH